jgi:hypothetical protein
VRLIAPVSAKAWKVSLNHVSFGLPLSSRGERPGLSPRLGRAALLRRVRRDRRDQTGPVPKLASDRQLQGLGLCDGVAIARSEYFGCLGDLRALVPTPEAIETILKQDGPQRGGTHAYVIASIRESQSRRYPFSWDTNGRVISCERPPGCVFQPC